MNAQEELELVVNQWYSVKYFLDHSRDAKNTSHSFVYRGTKWVDDEAVLVFGKPDTLQLTCIPTDLIQSIEEIKETE